MINQQLLEARKEKGWSIEVASARIGISRVTYSRWENGHQEPQPAVLEMLCGAFNKTAEDLGYSHLSKELQQTGSDEDMNRREAIKKIGVGAGTALLLIQHDLLDPDILERLLGILKKPSSIDEMTLAHLSGITKHYWQMFASTTGLTRYHLLGGLSGHLRTITGLLEYSLPTDIQNHLCILASETTQTIGEILFDINDSNTAETYYNIAVETAKNAHNNTLRAVALGRKSFIPVYGENPQQAILLLQEAHHLASQTAPDITHAWLSALEAEAYANNQDAHSCYKALEKAEHFLSRVKPDETGYARPGESEYARFSRTVLLGYKGVCYVRLHQPEAAQRVLFESIASMGDTRLRHKSITLVDLAMTYIQLGEITEACREAEQALVIMAHTRSPRTFDRVLDLRDELEQWKTEQSVKNLDEQIATLRPSVALWKR